MSTPREQLDQMVEDRTSLCSVEFMRFLESIVSHLEQTQRDVKEHRNQLKTIEERQGYLLKRIEELETK